MIRYSEWNDLMVIYANNNISFLPKKHSIGLNIDTGEIINIIPKNITQLVRKNNVNLFTLGDIGLKIKEGLTYFSNELIQVQDSIKINISFNIRDSFIMFSNDKLTNYYHCVGRIALCKEGVITYRDFGLKFNESQLGDKLLSIYNSMIYSQEETKYESLIDIRILESDEMIYILSPQAAAFFVHEVIGHLFERDNWEKNSGFLRLNNKILPSTCNIIDSPYSSEYMRYGEFDDMGNNIKESRVICEGCINDIIHTMRSAEYSQKPINRMLNLHMLSNINGRKLHQIINSYRKCIVIEEVINGGVNIHTGDFFISCGKSFYQDECDGKVYIKPYTLCGNIKDALNSVVEVGSDFGSYVGMCSKFEQSLYVNTGAPSIVLTALKIL